MATTEERMQILKMIESGQITAEEGAKLLAALNKVSEPKTGPPSGAPKWFRVRVTDLDNYEEVLAAIKSGTQGKVIDVVDEEDGERVEVFVE